MNDRILELAEESGMTQYVAANNKYLERFAEAIVKEMCGMMEQAEDDAYHCFEPSDQPTEYIGWLRYWRERFEKHFGVED
jgi:hypothetical protein